MRRPLMLALLTALVALLITTRFYPQVTRVEVLGASHYSQQEILALANLERGDPLLWVNGWRSRALVQDPWISRARIIRHWPDALSVAVWEREPFARFGENVYALDGTVLPNASTEQEGLVTLRGWGPERIDEALSILRLVASYEPEVLSYSPSGFDIRFSESSPKASLYTPSVELLETHWSGFVGQSRAQIAVYPWGVSVQ